MSESEERVTRGSGVLEGFLARKRANRANSLIPESLRHGKILDIGCGTFPYFLANTEFGEKYGLDKGVNGDGNETLLANKTFVQFHDITGNIELPFADGFFEAVTMLAVVEHVYPEVLPGLFKEIRRVLRTDGIFIMTTPAAWTEGLLKALSATRLLSPEEINEHKACYYPSGLASILCAAGFDRERISSGHFELFMNLWVTARK
jgi:SAM-dependent methyltransferase